MSENISKKRRRGRREEEKRISWKFKIGS